MLTILPQPHAHVMGPPEHADWYIRYTCLLYDYYLLIQNIILYICTTLYLYHAFMNTMPKTDKEHSLLLKLWWVAWTEEAMHSGQRGDKAGWQCPHLAHILHNELFRLNVLFGKETPGMNRAPPETQVLCATLYQNLLMYA